MQLSHEKPRSKTFVIIALGVHRITGVIFSYGLHECLGLALVIRGKAAYVSKIDSRYHYWSLFFNAATHLKLSYFDHELSA